MAGEPVVPGAEEVLGSGFDIVKGRNTLPVFQWSYEDASTFSPSFYPANKWAVPDGFMVRNTNKFMQREVTDIQTTYSEWATELAKQSGFHIGYGLNFDYSKESSDVHMELQSDSKAVGFSRASWSIYEMQAPPEAVLKPHTFLVKAIAHMPEQISNEAEQKQVNDFVDQFGTHYVTRANFGGRLDVDSFAEKHLIDTYDAHWVAKQMGFSFSFATWELGYSSFKNKSEIQIDKDFLSNSVTNLYFAGGSTMLQNQETLVEWSKTVGDAPHSLNMTIKGMEELVQRFGSAKKAALVSSVIKFYLENNEYPTFTTAEAKVGGSTDHLPGVDDFMGAGYDMVKLAPGLPVFKFDYSKPTTFSPNNGKTEWLVPDGVIVRKTLESREIIGQSLSDKYSEYVHTYVESNGVSVGIVYAGVGVKVGINRELGKAHTELSGETKYNSFSHHWWSHYSVNAAPSDILEPHPFFEKAVAGLPATISSAADHAKYTELIERWGTHYVIQANFGGRVNVDSYLEKSLMETHDEKWVKTEIGLSFSYSTFELGVSGYKNKSEIHVDSEFTSNSETTLFFEGGKQGLQSNESLHEWMESIVEAPHFLNYTTLLITDLIADKAKKALLADIVDQYLREGELPAYVASKRVGDSPNIFGLDVVGCGYDAASDEFKMCVTQNDFAADGVNTWVNPDYPELVYNVPKNMVIQNTPESFVLNSTYVFKKLEDWQTTVVHRHKSHGFFHSKTTTTTTYQSKFFLEDMSMAQSLRQFQWFTLTAPPLPPPATSSVFKNMVATLPSEFTAATAPQFQSFIDTFGTHYVTQADFGGRLECFTFFHKCFLQKYDEQWVEKSSSWGFGGIIGGGHGSSYHDKRVDADFSENSETYSSMYGGDITNYRVNQWADWSKTIKLAPSPINSRVEDIAMLIPDKQKSAAVLAASTDYLDRMQAQFDKESEELEKQDPHTMPEYCKEN